MKTLAILVAFLAVGCSASTEAPDNLGDAALSDGSGSDGPAADTSAPQTCARFGFRVSGAACPSTGCAAVTCSCPGAFPRSLTSCKKDGCLVAANCAEVCAAASLGDALKCTDTYGVGDAGPSTDAGTKDSGPTDSGGDACVKRTCSSLGANCGTPSDGCGGSLTCGTCSSPQTCGGGLFPFVCGCTRTTCAARGADCGTISDGCGGTLECGSSCASPKWCGGGGTANKCGCVPSGSAKRSPSNATSAARGGGTKAWTTPENVYTSNNARASVQLVNNEQTQWLVIKGFSFEIPPLAVIKGIEVRFERGQNIIETPISDAELKIVKGSAILGTDHASTATWPVTEGYVTYGSSTDLWGETFTASDINSAGFGVALATKYSSSAGNGWSFVDHAEVIVHFTVPSCTM